MATDLSELTADAVLRRARNLRLQVDSHNVVQVLRHGQAIDCGPRGLSILDIFHTPTRLGEALDRLEPTTQGLQDWIDVTGVIVGLYRSGVLKSVSSSDDDRTGPSDGGFADPMVHSLMLNDRARTATFIEAIQHVVKPGDVVLDLGTGSGVLAVAAARAGARRVFAIEAGDIARTARAVFTINGLEERIELLQGWSTHLTVPEPADVLVSEIIGGLALEERVLEATLDARQRLLKPGARLVPGRLRIFGVPVCISPEALGARAITGQAVRRWRDWYDIDLSPLVQAAHGSSHVVFLDPPSARDLPRLSDPVMLSDIDLAQFTQLKVDGEAIQTLARSGELNGVLVYFEADLSPTVSLTTDPARTDDESSWRNPVWFYNDPLPLTAGDSIFVSFAYRVPGKPNGVTVARASG